MSEKSDRDLPFGPQKRFGLFGGSFDPVHVGHLAIAQQVREKLGLDTVVLLPAAVAPHKAGGTVTPAADRLAMCRLAIHNLRGLAVSDFEIQRGGTSYTVETARAVRSAYGPSVEIFFLIGSDSLNDLPQWYKIDELLALIDFAIADRREAPITEAMWQRIREKLGAAAEAKLRRGVAEVQRVDVSSTLIRELLRKGEKTGGLLRRDVEHYIKKRGLYG